MKRLKGALIILSALLTISGCTAKNGASNIDSGEVNIHLQTETKGSTVVFYNSNQHASLESVEIQKKENDTVVVFHYANKDVQYVGKDIDGDIVLRVDNGDELHLYINGDNELRIYKVVENGFQPENIEWTFYKKINTRY